MGKMTVFHGGYEAIPRPEIRIGWNTKILARGFTVQLLRSRHSVGRGAMIQRLFLFMMCALTWD